VVFYASTAVQKMRNQTQGSWFVQNWMKNEQIPSVYDLKEKLKGKYTRFIEKLQYFSSSVPGSDYYWRNKRSNILFWINHSIQENNGASSLFITLFCAEYQWFDIFD
jgi:hypothetical protein